MHASFCVHLCGRRIHDAFTWMSLTSRSGATAKWMRRALAAIRAQTSSPVRECSSMATSDAGRGLVRCLGVTAAARVCARAASQQRAEALSLASPGTAPVSEVRNRWADDRSPARRRRRWRRWRWRWRWLPRRRRRWFPRRRVSRRWFPWRRRGVPRRRLQRRWDGSPPRRFSREQDTFSPAAAVFFAQRRIYRGGGHRDQINHAFHRPHFYHHRRHFHRRIDHAPAYYGYPRYYGHRYRHCRVIWTHYGPRNILQIPSLVAPSPLRIPGPRPW